MPETQLLCLKLWNIMIILADDRVVTCNSKGDAQLVMGDVHNSTIKEIYNGNEYQQVRQRHLDGEAKEVIVCGDCVDWYREAEQHNIRIGHIN